MGIISEFKQFIKRGSVIDLAVGVVIGGAFQKIVGSLVNDLIMPPIGLLLAGINFKDITYVLKEASLNANGEIIPAVMISPGSFIQTLIEFIIIAFSIFLLVKGINKVRKEEAAVPPPPPTREEELLVEIRNLLKTGNERL
jgi:large conductance mechanosensitive channel